MYKFRKGYHAPSGLVASRAAEEMERIRQIHGALTAKNIVEEARSEDSPIHVAFEWNDSVAAQKFREKQAMTLVRAIVIKASPKSTEEKPYLTLTVKDQQRQYVPTEVVVNDPQMYEYALKRANASLVSAKSALDTLLIFHNEHLSTKKRRVIRTAKNRVEKASLAVSSI